MIWLLILPPVALIAFTWWYQRADDIMPPGMFGEEDHHRTDQP